MGNCCFKQKKLSENRDTEILEEIKRNSFNETYEMITLNRIASSDLSVVPWNSKDLIPQINEVCALRKASSNFMIKQVDAKDEENVRKLVKEAELLKNLHHENVVPFYDFFFSFTGCYCLQTAFDGKDLQKMIKEKKEPYAFDFIMRVSKKTAEALSYLHNQKLLLHGNLNSSSILVKNNSEEVKVSSFQNSIKLNEDLLSLYEDVKYLGDFHRSPTEVFNGLRLTHKVDIYLYGLIIYEMLTLAEPYSHLWNKTNQAELKPQLLEHFGKRPPLINFSFNSSYKDCIVLFVACTNTVAEMRPSATDICSAFSNPKGFIIPVH